MSETNNVSQWYKNASLYGIKRKETELQKYIEVKRKNYVILKESLIISDMHELAKTMRDLGPENIAIINSKAELNNLFIVFANILNAPYYPGKIKPGTFTNPELREFKEVKGIFIIHDRRENQAVSEAKKLKLPVLGITNLSRGVAKFDKKVIMNNFAEISLCWGLYYLLSQLFSLQNKEIMSFEEFKTICNLHDSDIQK